MLHFIKIRYCSFKLKNLKMRLNQFLREISSNILLYRCCSSIHPHFQFSFLHQSSQIFRRSIFYCSHCLDILISFHFHQPSILSPSPHRLYLSRCNSFLLFVVSLQNYFPDSNFILNFCFHLTILFFSLLIIQLLLSFIMKHHFLGLVQ